MATFGYCGPSGGLGGGYFNDGQVGGQEVAEVRIRSGALIDAIQIVYVIDQTSHAIPRPRHGGNGGSPSVFRLAPGEYITDVGGKYGRYIDSLWIKTNRGRTKTWGGGGGSVDFFYNAPPGTRIFGFTGRSGVVLDLIGVIMRTP